MLRTPRPIMLTLFATVFINLTSLNIGIAEDATSVTSLADGLRPFVKILTGKESQFTLSGTSVVQIDGKPQSITMQLTRHSDESFDLSLAHPEYAVEIRRREESTIMILPLHKVAYKGTGDVPAEYRLNPDGILQRIISDASTVKPAVAILSSVTSEFIDPMISLVAEPLKPKRDPQTARWMLTAESPIRFSMSGKVQIRGDFGEVQLSVASSPEKPLTQIQSDINIVELSRSELEQTLVRGIHRATEILAPAAVLKKPEPQGKKVANGELRWIEGQRVAILQGTPEQIGTAHGQLLHDEATRCIESVLYTFGTAHVIRTGKWFRHDIQEAYAQLSPHIPERHKRETRSLAAALNLPAETLEVLNVFPEMFHCSGFAVFGSATTDGKLYHGRVLDYMTTIGLQDAATTFIVQPDGHLSFANVGYAAFIGSVSGMNTAAISLGEMGGRGEGNWNGVPMATLMRRALEECNTLDQVIELWTNSPRTCEYYYVFADGKTNRAVGVAALPESIDFIQPGEGHERLGEGIPDTVVLSAGSRLETLRQRVTEQHGKIDAEVGKWLMSRPVAMQSNLHNVLFIPEDGIFYVANASHSKPAAEQPYVKLNLKQLLPAKEQLPLKAAAAQ
ncbi:MAG: C45 family peptidase [Fuerstiella sp.]